MIDLLRVSPKIVVRMDGKVKPGGKNGETPTTKGDDEDKKGGRMTQKRRLPASADICSGVSLCVQYVHAWRTKIWTRGRFAAGWTPAACHVLPIRGPKRPSGAERDSVLDRAREESLNTPTPYNPEEAHHCIVRVSY